jgi:tRNA threonylcarbamoyladenosine biosynthesis protein TsaE
MELKLDISDLNSHAFAAQQVIDFAGKERIFLFDAPMGAGKTTFIKAICQYLKVTDTMSSPTYSIVNEYNTSNNVKIFHFDLYRLKSSEELFDIGFEEYLDSNQYMFIEWPEIAMSFLNSYVRISINSDSNNRYLCAEIFNSNA